VEKAHGPDHPILARSLSKLAAINQAEGKLARAESLYRCALEIRQKVLGPEHPEVVESLESLADLFRTMGREADAAALSAQARAIPVWSVFQGELEPLRQRGRDS
jgi:hypothetical protein